MKLEFDTADDLLDFLESLREERVTSPSQDLVWSTPEVVDALHERIDEVDSNAAKMITELRELVQQARSELAEGRRDELAQTRLDNLDDQILRLESAVDSLSLKAGK